MAPKPSTTTHSQSISSVVVSGRDRWMYSIFGPSTLHLQHEFCLLLSLICLFIAALVGTYKGASFGLSGDFQFLFLTSVWLSRHLLVRWYCTWDPSTSRSPTLRGVLSRLISSYFTAGQYFDRPDRQILAKQIGTNPVDETRITSPTSISSLHLPVLNYMGRLVRVWVWYPLLGIRNFMFRKGNNTSYSRSSNNNMMSRNNAQSNNNAPSPTLIKAFALWNNFWHNHGGKLQILIPLSTLAYYVWYFGLAEPSSAGEMRHALQGQAVKPEDMQAFGAYQKIIRPTWEQVMMVLSCVGTLASILLYGRLLLPVGDLVAGTNVLKAVRNESKHYAGTQSGGKSSRARTQKDHVDEGSWSEYYKSVAHENRFALFFKTGYIRVAEAVLLCAIMPITTFACRATGHCKERLSVNALSKILHFAGISSPLRSDSYTQDQTFLREFDIGTTIVVALSAMFITSTLLAAQAVTVNRSFLSITGYVAGQWVLVKDNDPSLEGASASFWDSRRRYKKGDLVLYKPLLGGKLIYRATSNAPEGRPFDMFLSLTHDFLTNELGHQERSDIICYASWIQLTMLYLVGVVIMIYQLLDYHVVGLGWAFVANAVAAFGLIQIGLSDRRELHSLSQQIS